MEQGRYFVRDPATLAVHQAEADDQTPHDDGYRLAPATEAALAARQNPPLDWVFRDNFDYSPARLTALKEEAAREWAERKRLEAEVAAKAPEEGDQGCTVS